MKTFIILCAIALISCSNIEDQKSQIKAQIELSYLQLNNGSFNLQSNATKNLFYNLNSIDQMTLESILKFNSNYRVQYEFFNLNIDSIDKEKAIVSYKLKLSSKIPDAPSDQIDSVRMCVKNISGTWLLDINSLFGKEFISAFSHGSKVFNEKDSVEKITKEMNSVSDSIEHMMKKSKKE